MADIVRLAIVYDTSRAAAALRGLDTQLATTARTTTTTNHATATLKRGLVGLAMQATATSGPVGQLTQALLLLGGGTGAILIVAGAISGLALAYEAFTKDTRDAEAAQKELVKQLQQVGIHAELTAAKIQLTLLRGQQSGPQTLGQVWQQFLSDMTGGKLGVSRDEQHERAARAIAEQMTLIVNLEKKAADVAKAHNEELRKRLAIRAAEMAQGLFLAQQGVIRGAEASDRRLRGMDPSRLRPVADVPELANVRRHEHDVLQATREVTRAEVLFTRGLFTMADAIEEFVVTGTFAFTDFLDNILRLLYRDFTGNLVSNITGSLFPGTNTGPSGGGGGGKDLGGLEKNNVTSNVTFAIQTMDAQGVAQWVNQNGAQIAAEITRQATRSSAMRRKLTRG